MQKTVLHILKAGLLSLLIVCPLFAAEAIIHLQGYSEGDVVRGAISTQRAMPLTTIGLQQPVYLKSLNEGTYSWSLTGPSGSTAALDSTDTRQVYFKPDVKGTYTVSLAFTDTSGTTNASLDITGATYVGVGTIGGATAKFPQCALCHADKATEWSGTGHATMLERGLKGTVSSHYAGACISCHSVGYDTLAVNGGWDDVAKSTGWTFPDSLNNAAWDSVLARPALAQLANIQCENCHGPGSEHQGNTAKISKSLDAGTCAYCHDDNSHHIYPVQWANSMHGKEFDPSEHWNRAGNSCVPCHTAEGFFEVNVSDAHTSTAPYKDLHGQTCQVCHDPHEAAVSGAHQLRVQDDYNSIDTTTGIAKYKSDGTIEHACDVCHHLRPGTDVPGSRMHESQQSDMLNGTAGYLFPGKAYPKSLHNQFVTERCVGCHMHSAPADKAKYVGSHTFAVRATYTDSSGVSQTVYNTDACTDCHSDIGSDFDYRGMQTKITTLLEEIAAKLPQSSPGSPRYSTADYTSGKITELQMQAAYNYYLVEYDGSRGIHNPVYIETLLENTLTALGGPLPEKTCDITGDGQNNISDVIFLLLLSRADPTDSRLDYNGDGSYGINDAIAMLIDIRNGTCPNKTTLLASVSQAQNVKARVYTADEIKYLDQIMTQLNLTPSEQAEYQLALFGQAGQASLPKAYALAQNSPNPFNPATTINYSVPEGASAVQVKIEVFDIRGQLITTLVDEAKDPGTYTVFWNGSTRNGGQVSSGVYLYRMRAGSFVQTRKMVVLK